MKKKLLSFFVLVSIALSSVFAQQHFSLLSPNGKLKAEIAIHKTIEYSVVHAGDIMLTQSPVALKLSDGRDLGARPQLLKTKKQTVNEQIAAVIYKKNKITNNYNELILSFKGDYQLVFRAYDDGVAYRFVTTMKQPFIVENETAVFNFPANLV